MVWDVEKRVSEEVRREAESNPLSEQEIEQAVFNAIDKKEPPENGFITADQLTLKILSEMQEGGKPIEYIKFQLLCYYSFAWYYTCYKKKLADINFIAVDWGYESLELQESFKKFVKWIDSGEDNQGEGQITEVSLGVSVDVGGLNIEKGD